MPQRVEEPGMGILEVTSESFLFALCKDVFENYWSSIRFGVLDELTPMHQPDWTRLALWDHLRRTCLGLDSDPKDHSTKRFHHA